MKAFASRLLLTLLCVPPAFAASSTDLAVKGSITPSACAPLMSGGSEIDFGKMTVKDLNSDHYTSLPGQSLHLSVVCEGPTFFTLNTIDNRAGTSASPMHWHGLGMTPHDEKLGGVAFRVRNPVADGAVVSMVISSDGVTWNPSDILSYAFKSAVASNSGQLAPIAVKDFNADLRLFTRVAPADELTLIDEVPIDGHVTVQLNYL
jgi:hypothetical protein